jgi:hypothetical protein
MSNSPTSPSETTPVYCTDEDIAVLCFADYYTLAPKDQVIAVGSDGVFLNTDLWTLNSASVDFNAQQLAVGNVVTLTGPTGTFSGSGVKFAVAAVNPNQVTLRRIGKPPAWGQPASPIGGITGVSFVVRTFSPQIEYASYQIKKQFGIDENNALISSSQLYDQRELQQVTVLWTVVDAYRTDTRSKEGDFAIKLKRYETQLTAVLDRMMVKWNSATGENPRPITRFNCMYTR